MSSKLRVFTKKRLHMVKFQRFMMLWLCLF